MEIKREALNKRLAELMEKRVPEIAQKTGISQSSLYYYCKDRMPEADKLWKISQATGKSMEWLLTGKEEPRAPDGTFIVAEAGENYSQPGLLQVRNTLDQAIARQHLLLKLLENEGETLAILDKILHGIIPTLSGRKPWTEHLDELTLVAKKAVNYAARSMQRAGEATEELKKAS